MKFEKEELGHSGVTTNTLGERIRYQVLLGNLSFDLFNLPNGENRRKRVLVLRLDEEQTTDFCEQSIYKRSRINNVVHHREQ